MSESNFNDCKLKVQNEETKYVFCNQQQPLLTDKSQICEVQLVEDLSHGLQICQVMKINRRDVFTRMYAIHYEPIEVGVVKPKTRTNRNNDRPNGYN